MTISEAHNALYDFWSSFGVPAYIQARIPRETQLPYITFTVEVGAALETVYLTAFTWHQAASGENVMQERARLMDSIAAAIPEAGLIVDAEDGYMRIERGRGAWLSYYDDPDDPSVIGGRIAYTVTYYT